MFTFQDLVEATAKTTKSGLAYVQDKELRKSLESVVDANVTYLVSINNLNTEISKVIVEKAKEQKVFEGFAKAFEQFNNFKQKAA